MSGDVLSQAEVESLLSAMEQSAQRATTPRRNSEGAAASAKAAPTKPREKVTPYDFKRPERVGKEQMRALQSMHEGFGRNFGARLSTLLRSIVEVKLTSVDQLTYSEFTYSLENPTCFNVLRAEPLEGSLILDINPSILFPVIDRMLGGGKEAQTATRRPCTEIELRLVGKITTEFLEELKKAWENVMSIDFKVDKVESNPQLVQIVPPNEVVILISFELLLGEQRGMINLCIPFNSIERIGGKLSSNNWSSSSKRTSTPETMERVSKSLRGATIEVIVHLADTTISTKDLLGLRVGDVITTETDVRSALTVDVEGVAKFRAKAGSFKGKKAICIEDLGELKRK
jgi:flagellar motor switch protein FliM